MTFRINMQIFILSLILLSQIFSPVLYVPEGENYGISVFRFLLIVTSLLIYIKNGTINIGLIELKSLYFLLLLIIWLTFSLFWSNNFSYGVKHISYFLTIAMIVYVLSNLINTYSDFRNFCGIISIFGLIIIFIAYYEITSGVHFFRSSLQDTSELDRSLSYITENQAWFTFGNPNDLSVHVVVCLFATVAFSRSIFYTAFYFFTVLYLVQFLDSRILVVSLVIFALVFCAMVVQKTPKSAINITIVSLIGGLSGLVTILVFIDRVEFLDISSFIRLQLVSSALDMAKHTLLIGIGAGGFETEMWQGGYLGRTTGIVNPHNGFARILAENGIVGLALFLCLLFGPLIAMRRASSLNILLVAISSSVVVLPLLLSVGSDPLSSSSLQLAIAFLWVGARFATNDDHNRNFAPDSLSYVLGQRRIA